MSRGKGTGTIRAGGGVDTSVDAARLGGVRHKLSALRWMASPEVDSGLTAPGGRGSIWADWQSAAGWQPTLQATADRLAEKELKTFIRVHLFFR
jgi:hypothetical protein